MSLKQPSGKAVQAWVFVARSSQGVQVHGCGCSLGPFVTLDHVMPEALAVVACL
jgi:hypothetical protein